MATCYPGWNWSTTTANNTITIKLSGTTGTSDTYYTTSNVIYSYVPKEDPKEKAAEKAVEAFKEDMLENLQKRLKTALYYGNNDQVSILRSLIEDIR